MENHSVGVRGGQKKVLPKYDDATTINCVTIWAPGIHNVLKSTMKGYLFILFIYVNCIQVNVFILCLELVAFEVYPDLVRHDFMVTADQNH